LDNIHLKAIVSFDIGLRTNLLRLNLMQNDLMGPISKQIGFLVEMKEMIPQRNSLTSLIPSEVGLLANLMLAVLEQQFSSGKLSDRKPVICPPWNNLA